MSGEVQHMSPERGLLFHRKIDIIEYRQGEFTFHTKSIYIGENTVTSEKSHTFIMHL